MLFIAMTQLLFAWILAILLIAGLGSLIRRAWGQAPGGLDDFLFDFWLGWAVTLAFLQLWHLGLRIGPWAWLPLALAGGAGAAEWVRPWRGARPVSGVWVQAALGMALAAAVANLALGTPLTYDAGLYHLSAIHWAFLFPVVPGLANLQMRMGYNSAHFLYGALWRAVLGVRGFHFVNGSFLVVFLGQGLLGGWRLARRISPNPRRDLFLLLMLPGALAVGRVNVNSPSPDLPVYLVEALIGVLTLDILCARRGPAPGDREGFELFVLLTLCAASLTVKLSMIVFAGLAALLALGGWFVRRGGARPVVWGCVAALALLIPWMGRGVILSGYPCYPSTVGAFPVDWRVPRQTARYDALLIRAWPRRAYPRPEEVLNNWSWLGPWARNLLRQERWALLNPVLLALAGLIGMVRQRRRIPGGGWLFLLVPAAAALFWFWSAPLPRYAGAIFWSAAAGTLTLGATGGKDGAPSLQPRWTWWALGLVAVCCAGISVRLPWQGRAGPDGGFFPPPHPSLRVSTNRFGLSVFVPADPRDNRTWDAALMATDLEHPGLRLRRPGDLAGGFAEE